MTKDLDTTNNISNSTKKSALSCALPEQMQKLEKALMEVIFVI